MIRRSAHPLVPFRIPPLQHPTASCLSCRAAERWRRDGAKFDEIPDRSTDHNDLLALEPVPPVGTPSLAVRFVFCAYRARAENVTRRDPVPGVLRRLATGPRSRPISFFVISASRHRRCTVSDEALRVLARRKLVTHVQRRRAFVRHRAWLHALAMVMLVERHSPGILRIEKSDVVYQLACEATELPDVLCV